MNFIGFIHTPTSRNVRVSVSDKKYVNPHASHIKAPYAIKIFDAKLKAAQSNLSHDGVLLKRVLYIKEIPFVDTVNYGRPA
jgi:hypothetical protein